MTSIADFFSPVENKRILDKSNYNNAQLGSTLQIYAESFPDILNEDEKPHLAFFGVQEDRGALNNEGCTNGADHIRPHLYRLYSGDYSIKMTDLGNIRRGKTIQDTYFALRTVVETLVKEDIVPIIIGGGHDLTYAQYRGYEHLEQRVEVALIDSKFDLDQENVENAPLNSNTFLNHIILHEPDFLFNLNSIAYQNYLVSQESIIMYDKLFFTHKRLGELANDYSQAEPAVRAADLVSFDIGSIRHSDASANQNAGPNGLFGNTACQIARYAGMSDKCSSFGIYEYNPSLDQNQQSAMLLAQMVWCFIDGYYQRKNDAPLIPKSDYIIYKTQLESQDHELVFVKSKKSDRWWMQVPYQGFRSVNERYYLAPCSYSDYETAVSGEMPDLWWRTHQKLL